MQGVDTLHLDGICVPLCATRWAQRVRARRASNDFLLPTMITFLNSRDWQLRAAFFRSAPCLAVAAGQSGIEDFLLPCCLQARPTDGDEAGVQCKAWCFSVCTLKLALDLGPGKLPSSAARPAWRQLPATLASRTFCRPAACTRAPSPGKVCLAGSSRHHGPRGAPKVASSEALLSVRPA